MTEFSRRGLFWTPRVLSILFIAFISIFALDVFGEGRGFWQTLAALAMHLVPSFVLIGVLLLAWRWEWVGALLYAAAGGWHIRWVLLRRLPTAVKLNWILVIAGPVFVIAVLFLINWWKHDEIRARGPAAG